jgi:site-specific DNA recombinase
MNVALYLRMSTDKQDTSIPQQRAALERHAEKAGHTIVREYRDEGISGDATSRRKGFQKMIAEARAGDFDRILCFDQDRFGRFDMIEAGHWITPLRDAGVSLETIAQGAIDWNDFAGRLTYAVAQEGKHQFLRDLSRNCLRGHVAKAKAGEGMYGASAAYGYRRESTIEGRRRITNLVPHEFEASVVRRIFETYCGTGGTLLAVGELLNREKIPSPAGRAPWHRNAVRRILRNRTYVGDYVWGKTTSGKYHTRAGDEVVPKRRGGRRKVASDPIVHEGILPALVSHELFDKAQELLDQRRKATRRPGTIRPLSGLITCSKCGSPMHVNFGDYRCSRSVDFGDGTRCTNGIARGEYLLRVIGEQLQQRILAPKKLAALKAKLHRLVQTERKKAAGSGTAELDREIAEMERQIAEGIARIPLLPKSLVPEMAKGLDTMRQQRDTLKRQRDATKPRSEGRRAPMQSRIDEAIAAAYGLPKVLAEADAALVNERLRELGLRVLVGERKATVVIDLLNPEKPAKSREKAVLTCNARAFERDKSPEGFVIAFEVPLPAENKAKKRSRAG